MIPYLLHTAILTALLYLAYRLLLTKETFFKLNRVILVGSILIAFLLPLIPIPADWSLRPAAPIVQVEKPSPPPSSLQIETAEESLVITTPDEPIAEIAPSPPASPKPQKTMNFWSILFITYLVGVVIMGVNLGIQLVAILYQILSQSHIQDGKVRIVELDNDKAPFSFANCVFINPTLYDWDTYSQILEHEKTHVEQGHSFDILLAEILVVVQWFNPFAWMLRRTVEDNLEYLTDEQMIAKGVDRESYQMNLLKVAVPYHPLGPANSYNQSTLKNRISMMNIKKSSLSSSWKYLFVLALFGLSTVFFNPTLATAKSSKDTAEADLDQQRNLLFPNKGIWSATFEDGDLCIRYDLSERKRNNWWVTTKCYPKADFPNLPMDQDGTFSLKRAAGTINFNGKFENEEGLGRFTFTPNESFRALIKQEGYSKVSDEVLFGFTLANIDQEYWAYLKQEGLTPKDEDDLEDIGHHLPLLANLKSNFEGYRALGFKKLTLEEVVDLSIHNATPEFIKSIQQLGFTNLSLDEYQDAKIHNINGEFISEMKDLGFKDLSFEEVEDLKIHGVNKAFVEELKKAGYTNLNAQDVTDAMIHNVSTKFAAEMKELGFSNLTLEELEELKIHGVSAEFVAELKKAGYQNLSSKEVTDAKIHGITPQLAEDMKALGFSQLSLDELQDLKIHGVNAAYVAELKKAGYQNLSPEEVMDAKIHGITPRFAEDMKALGFTQLSLDELQNLKIHGISAAYVAELKKAGYENLSPEEVTDAKIHGITPQFAEKMKALGFTQLSLEDLEELKIHGVNATYVAELKKAGYENLSPEEVKDAKIHGITPEFAEEMKALGFTRLSLDELQDLKIHRVNAAYVAELKKAGYTNLSPEEVTDAKIHNLSTKFVQEMAKMGYKNVPIDDMMDAAIHRVTSAYAQAMKDEGLTNLSLEELVELKIHGVSPQFIRKVKDMGMDNLSAEDYLDLKRMGIEQKLNKKQK